MEGRKNCTKKNKKNQKKQETYHTNVIKLEKKKK